MKRCAKCERVLVVADFYANDSKCKECRCAAVRQNREARRDHYLEFDRKRANDPGRVAHRKAYLATPAGQAAHRKAVQNDRHSNPLKERARAALARALRSGTVTKQPCEKCGDGPAHGHHEDYAKPLDVKWLCALHHAQAHGKALSK